MNKKEFIEMIGEIFSSEFLAPRKIKVLKVDDTFEDTFEVRFVALDSEGHELPQRDFKVRRRLGSGTLEVSHGMHSSTETPKDKMIEADNIQNVVVGEISKELLTINA